MNATTKYQQRARARASEAISPAQVRCVYAQLRELGMTDEVRSIVSAYTARRTDRVPEMNGLEAHELITALKQQNPLEARAIVMRNKILSMAHEMNWRKPGTTEVDMQHVNNWCCTYGHLKKKLDAYTYRELPELVSQFEIIYQQYLKKV